MARLHEYWTGEVADGYDIAMLKLDRETDLVLPGLDVYGNVYRPGQVFHAIGWGATRMRVVAKTLQIAQDLFYLNFELCKGFWGNVLENDTMICAGYGQDDTCKGRFGLSLQSRPSQGAV